MAPLKRKFTQYLNLTLIFSTLAVFGFQDTTKISNNDPKMEKPSNNEKNPCRESSLSKSYEWVSGSRWNNHFRCKPPVIDEVETEQICDNVKFKNETMKNSFMNDCNQTLKKMFENEGVVRLHYKIEHANIADTNSEEYKSNDKMYGFDSGHKLDYRNFKSWVKRAKCYFMSQTNVLLTYPTSNDTETHIEFDIADFKNKSGERGFSISFWACHPNLNFKNLKFSCFLC